MPFKSEEQRKYLWANEPEIARDWTDTYGSGIHKAKGGRIGFQYGSPAEDRSRSLAGTHAAENRAYNRNIPDRGTPDNQLVAYVPPSKPDRGEQINQALNKYIPGRVNTNLGMRYDALNKYLGEDPSRRLALIKQGVIDEDESWIGDITSSQSLADLKKYTDYKGGYHDVNDPRHPDYDPRGRGEGQGVDPWLYPPGGIADTGTGSSTVAGLGLGQGHFQVPLDLVVNQQRVAEGGIIGSVGGTSRQKYQEGNMVGAEMEGAEMEGAMMQSKEVIKELYDALIAQGLSPQEAIEKIKEIIASSQEQGPESPMMGEEFPGQEFGGGPRAPAAFGGIMDTYTGRRKYGLGSFIKKAVNKVKKLASSKLGKIALMYAAGTYLGGTTAFGGAGTQTFAQRLADPKLLANLLNPTGGGIGEGKGWSMFQKTPALNLSSANRGFNFPLKSTIGDLGKLAGETVKKGTDWSKYILPASVAAGLYTAEQPLGELDDTTEEWDEEKAEWDKYYAGLGGSYRLPADLRAAQGGRIGRQEGGLMDLGGMEKDYREDGGFVPLGGEEKADDVPARLSRNEFVFTADAVKNAGGGDIDKGAEVMENVMKNLEAGGKVSEESQGQGAEEMFEVSERLSEVV